MNVIDPRKIEELIAAGPPKEPGKDNPGPLMLAMLAAEAALKKEKGGDPTAEDLIGALITILDYNHWRAEMVGYQKLVALHAQIQAATEKRIVPPQAGAPVPPRRVKP